MGLSRNWVTKTTTTTLDSLGSFCPPIIGRTAEIRSVCLSRGGVFCHGKIDTIEWSVELGRSSKLRGMRTTEHGTEPHSEMMATDMDGSFAVLFHLDGVTLCILFLCGPAAPVSTLLHTLTRTRSLSPSLPHLCLSPGKIAFVSPPPTVSPPPPLTSTLPPLLGNWPIFGAFRRPGTHSRLSRR